jgi:D-alanyl-D-alanine endopeptidase (penicillin-binding protein 7)
VRNTDWHLELSKTGFVNEAGLCLVMRAVIGGRLLSIVLLDSPGKRSPVGDSTRLRKWLESQKSGLSGAVGDRPNPPIAPVSRS